MAGDRALSISLEIGDVRLALQTFFHIKTYYCTGDFEGMEKIAQRMMGMVPDVKASPLSRIYYDNSTALAIAMNASPVGDKQEFRHVEEGMAIANYSGIHNR